MRLNFPVWGSANLELFSGRLFRYNESGMKSYGGTESVRLWNSDIVRRKQR